MSDSVQPHRREPTGLPCLWDSQGKNTGVDCHFLLQCMKVKSESEVSQSCPTLSDPMDCSPPGSSIHGIFQAGVLEWGAIAFSEKFCYREMNKITAYVHMIQYPAFTNDICFEDEGQCLIYLSPGTLGYLSAHKKMCKEDFNRLKTRTVCMPDLWINFHLHTCKEHQIIKVRASSTVMANTSFWVPGPRRR